MCRAEEPEEATDPRDGKKNVLQPSSRKQRFNWTHTSLVSPFSVSTRGFMRMTVKSGQIPEMVKRGLCGKHDVHKWHAGIRIRLLRIHKQEG